MNIVERHKLFKQMLVYYRVFSSEIPSDLWDREQFEDILIDIARGMRDEMSKEEIQSCLGSLVTKYNETGSFEFLFKQSDINFEKEFEKEFPHLSSRFPHLKAGD